MKCPKNKLNCFECEHHLYDWGSGELGCALANSGRMKKCPSCGTELERKWDTYWSNSKQRITKQLLYFCPKHNKLFQNFKDGLQELYPNHKVYAKLGIN